MSVLVTGGAGFIGSHLVDRLLAEGYDVKVVDDLSSGKMGNLNLRNTHLTFVKGDVRNKKVIENALEKVDFVFHLAAIIDVSFSLKNPLLVNDVNVCGSLNVLNESVKQDVERFVYASSCAVYGASRYLPVDEEHPTNPLSPYAVSKLSVENYCRVFNEVYGIGTVSLRFFNVYGPRQGGGSYGGVIWSFINQLKQRQVPVIFGDGMQTRDFVYVEDVVEAIFQASRSKRCVGEKINVGSGRETSILQLAEILTRKFGLKDAKFKHAEPLAGEIRKSCANIEKAKRLLGYKPGFSLEEGLDVLLEKNS